MKSSVWNINFTKAKLYGSVENKVKSYVSALKEHKNFNLLPHDDDCRPWYPSPRILGGGDTSLGEFPSLVVLFLNRKCGLTKYYLQPWLQDPGRFLPNQFNNVAAYTG